MLRNLLPWSSLGELIRDIKRGRGGKKEVINEENKCSIKRKITYPDAFFWDLLT